MITSLCVMALIAKYSFNADRNQELIEGANERIERYRKSDCDIKVVDSQGNPVPNAHVAIHMKKHEFLFGCEAFPLLHLKGDLEKKYEDNLTLLFNFATVGLYWGDYEKTKGTTNKAPILQQVAWLQGHGFTVKGHPIVYAQAWPTWAPTDAEGAKAAIHDRINQVLNDYKGVLHIWDGYNELPDALEKWNAPNGVSGWAASDGQEAVARQILAWEKEADPTATIVANDSIGTSDLRRQKLIDFAMKIQGGDPHPDIIGFQAHQHNGELTNEQIWDMCEKLGSTGAPLHCTEVSIISGDHRPLKQTDVPWPSTPDGEERQAKEVTRFYRMLFSNPHVQAITWWDLQDGQWLKAPSGLVRENEERKPGYGALFQLIRKDWWTDTTATTGADGATRFRGFNGTYEIDVDSGTQKGTWTGKVGRDQSNKVVITLQ